MPYQQRQTREAELSRSIVNHIDLAGIEAGLELGEGHVELEYRRLAVGRIQLLAFDQRGFVGLGLSAKEGDVGQQPNGGTVAVIRLSGCIVPRRALGS